MTEADENKLEELVRQAGRRTPLPDDVRARLEDSFRKELNMVQRKRLRRRAQILSGIAASFILAVLLIVFNSQRPDRPEIASVERTRGHTFWQYDEQTGPLRPGNLIKPNDVVRTSEGWLAITPSGLDIDIRLNRLTEVIFLDRETVRLIKGSLYIDAGLGAKHQAFRILTNGIAIEHLGTQYLVSSDDDGISIAVREGEVLIEIKDQLVRSNASDNAGQLTKIDQFHQFTTTRILTHGQYWDWASKVAPDINTDGMPLNHFLEWVARESGMTIVYSSAEIRDAASNDVILQGPIPTKDVMAALLLAMPLTPFRASVADGVITVEI